STVPRDNDDEIGRDGTIRVQDQRSPRAHTRAFLKAVAEVGLPVVAANGRDQQGFSQTLVSQHNGARFSTVDAYLKPARKRANLTVQTGAHTTRVLFDGDRAVGVEYVRNGVTRTARATGEVVLCGGAVNTP